MIGNNNQVNSLATQNIQINSAPGGIAIEAGQSSIQRLSIPRRLARLLRTQGK